MKLFSFISLIFIVGCASNKPTPIVPDSVTDDQLCDKACIHIRDQLHCEQGETLEDGTTCEQFCHYMVRNGHEMNNACRQSVNTCDEIDTTCKRSKAE